MSTGDLLINSGHIWFLFFFFFYFQQPEFKNKRRFVSSRLTWRFGSVCNLDRAECNSIYSICAFPMFHSAFLVETGTVCKEYMRFHASLVYLQEATCCSSEQNMAPLCLSRKI